MEPSSQVEERRMHVPSVIVVVSLISVGYCGGKREEKEKKKGTGENNRLAYGKVRGSRVHLCCKKKDDAYFKRRT